ncbi:hypothetical protein EUGRSUZ_F04016 [Eucalyptus grandis]|uniref:Uncharacterized protein n=2 Tax=Eucalyptus grandis TaxID=71139 RepID=A0ACC3KPC4_EUCGR|nr:hypothetical protein EUGRSUZ_F04016 [Eucalyptus grandis]
MWDDIGMDTPLFPCVFPWCFRSFHFHCSPFPWPEMIRSKCHFHLFTFAKAVLEEDLGECYCVACKTQKNQVYTVTMGPYANISIP